MFVRQVDAKTNRSTLRTHTEDTHWALPSLSTLWGVSVQQNLETWSRWDVCVVEPYCSEEVLCHAVWRGSGCPLFTWWPLYWTQCQCNLLLPPLTPRQSVAVMTSVACQVRFYDTLRCFSFLVSGEVLTIVCAASSRQLTDSVSGCPVWRWKLKRVVKCYWEGLCMIFNIQLSCKFLWSFQSHIPERVDVQPLGGSVLHQVIGTDSEEKKLMYRSPVWLNPGRHAGVCLSEQSEIMALKATAMLVWPLTLSSLNNQCRWACTLWAERRLSSLSSVSAGLWCVCYTLIKLDFLQSSLVQTIKLYFHVSTSLRVF